MQHLMRNAGAVCTRAELLSEVWGYAFDPGSNVVDVTIARLRGKLQRPAHRDGAQRRLRPPAGLTVTAREQPSRTTRAGSTRSTWSGPLFVLAMLAAMSLPTWTA